MLKIEDIKRFLRDNKYIVTAKKIKGGCELKFPSAKLLGIAKSRVVTYVVGEKDNQHGLFVRENKEEYFAPISKSLILVAVESSIQTLCESIQYSTDVIDCPVSFRSFLENCFSGGIENE